MAAADLVALAIAGIRVTFAYISTLLLVTGSLLLIARVYERRGHLQSLPRIAVVVAQFVVASSVTLLWSYAITALSGPLADPLFAAVDRALGFEWAAWTGAVAARPAANFWLAIAYHSMLPQVVVILIVLSARDDTANDGTVHGFLWGMLIAAVVTIAISGFVPAVGNLTRAAHVSDFNALRSGRLHTIGLGATNGLVAFPSYHTTVGVLLIHAAGRFRPAIRAVVVVLNLVMIVATLSAGGHYLIDVVAGVAVALLSVAAVPFVKRFTDLRLSAPRLARPVESGERLGA